MLKFVRRSNVRRRLALLSLAGFLAQQLAMPLHFMLEEHSWGHAASPSAELATGGHYHSEGMIADHSDHDQHHGDDSSSRGGSNLDQPGLDQPGHHSHPPHSAEDHLTGAPALDRVTSSDSSPDVAKIAVLLGTVELPANTGGRRVFSEPPRLRPPSVSHHYASRAPPLLIS